MTQHNLSRRAVLALGGSAVLGASLVATSARADVTTLTAPQAHEAARTGEILLVDVRRPDEWADTGSGEYAVRIDMRDRDFMAQVRAARTSDNQPVAVICRHGIRSRQMTRQLAAANISPIIDVPEGMLGSAAGPGWVARGLPVVR